MRPSAFGYAVFALIYSLMRSGCSPLCTRSLPAPRESSSAAASTSANTASEAMRIAIFVFFFTGTIAVLHSKKELSFKLDFTLFLRRFQPLGVYTIWKR